MRTSWVSFFHEILADLTRKKYPNTDDRKRGNNGFHRYRDRGERERERVTVRDGTGFDQIGTGPVSALSAANVETAQAPALNACLTS